jgi:hypothetical protein
MGRLRCTTSSPARPTTATEPRSRGKRRDESIIACMCGPCIPAGLPLSPLARCALRCRPRTVERESPESVRPCPLAIGEGRSPFPIESVLERNAYSVGRALMPYEERGCEASTSALSRDWDARQVSSQRWWRAKSGTVREEATGTGSSVKSTINYLDHSHQGQRCQAPTPDRDQRCPVYHSSSFRFFPGSDRKPPRRCLASSPSAVA